MLSVRHKQPRSNKKAPDLVLGGQGQSFDGDLNFFCFSVVFDVSVFLILAGNVVVGVGMSGFFSTLT
jgi:hypothetical protein